MFVHVLNVYVKNDVTAFIIHIMGKALNTVKPKIDMAVNSITWNEVYAQYHKHLLYY